MTDYNQAYAFISALTGNQADTALVDFRMIHDVRKDIPAIPIRDTLANAWNSITTYNSQGYGAFATISEMDGAGRELSNVQSVRAHFIDLDDLSALQNYERAAAFYPAPAFAVSSSASKFHVYWPSSPYKDNDRFQVIQRKLYTMFSGDRKVIDASRVMRLPGTMHQKADANGIVTPRLVTCWSLPGMGYVTPPETLEAALAHINVTHTTGGRKELGDPEHAAPGMEWLVYALTQHDPNNMDRGEWISFTSAFKQAGWSLTDETTLFNMWSNWCGQYAHNDQGENLKQWNSIRATEIGWKNITNRTPGIKAKLIMQDRVYTVPSTFDNTVQPETIVNSEPTTTPDNTPPMPQVDQPRNAPTTDCSGEFLDHMEQRNWFNGCILVESFGEILVPTGRLMNPGKFNARYGGKKFLIDTAGAKTDEAWKAATRSTLWTIPKADHIRFLPHEPHLSMVADELGRIGVNTYKPALIKMRKGDPTPFFNHIANILPVASDQKTFYDFIAHNAKYPGHKIPWAMLIQSEEGAGKGVIKSFLRHVMGGPYVHFPNATEMIESGSKFNAWMRAKLFIVVDEIKVDERRDMIEILKPMISEKEIEVQSKGHDQDKEDNYSNWIFFSNFKDAIPIRSNGRRFAIMYSAIQSVADLLVRGMDQAYFDRLYAWQENGGNEIVADYLINTYPIERGAIPMRAPDTSSTPEAIRQSRGPIEQLVLDAIADGLPGFRGGWISSAAVAKRIKECGHRAVSLKTISVICEGLGFHQIDRAPKAFFQENPAERAILYALVKNADILTYGQAQGYE